MGVNTDCNIAPAPVHGVVEYETAEFAEMFPALASAAAANETLFESYFDLATMIVRNTCESLVTDANQRLRLLYLLVAHIATLTPMTGGAGSGGGMVGPVSSATEGSVSISSGFAAQVSQEAAWFAQTQYGFTFWQLTAVYRTMRYVAPAQCCGPAGAFAGRRGY